MPPKRSSSKQPKAAAAAEPRSSGKKAVAAFAVAGANQVGFDEGPGQFAPEVPCTGSLSVTEKFFSLLAVLALQAAAVVWLRFMLDVIPPSWLK